MESARVVLELTGFFTAMVKRIVEAVEKFGEEYDARSLEAFVEEQVKTLGALILEVCWRLRLLELTPPKRLECECGHYKRLRGRRSRVLRLVLGLMNIEERRYYRCERCGATEYWGDELRGETDFSQLAEDRIAVAGKDGAYRKAAETLERMGVFPVAPSTVRNVCLRLGGKLCARADRAVAAQYGIRGERPEEHPERLAISVDGTMMGRVDPQHRRRRSRRTGRKVRGKGRLRHFFQEVKTLVVFSLDSAGEAVRKTYYATQGRVEAFREQVYLEAARRGAQTAKELVFLGDGAAWVWKTARELFPRAIQVLDWYHAMEHVWAVGRAGFGSRTEALRQWVEARETELWNGRAEAVIEAVREVSARLGAPEAKLGEPARALDARWIAFRNIGYFEENKARMNYPSCRDKGLPMASGVVESSCKHLVGGRLKGPGMRWDDGGAESILALRCGDLNGRWDSLWDRKAAA